MEHVDERIHFRQGGHIAEAGAAYRCGHIVFPALSSCRIAVYAGRLLPPLDTEEDPGKGCRSFFNVDETTDTPDSQGFQTQLLSGRHLPPVIDPQQGPPSEEGRPGTVSLCVCPGSFVAALAPQKACWTCQPPGQVLKIGGGFSTRKQLFSLKPGLAFPRYQ
jgi:hypothetical protein